VGGQALGEWPPGALRGEGQDVTSAETICSISVSTSSVEDISGAQLRCRARLTGATACVPPSRTACVLPSSSSQQEAAPAACLMAKRGRIRDTSARNGG